MPKNSFLRAIFPGIKYSVSPIEKPVKGNVKIGKVVPVYKTMVQGKESVRLDFSHLLRFAPLNVPVMEGYRVDFDVFKVPVSSIAYANREERTLMDFHNLALNDGTVPNPFSKLIKDVSPMLGNQDGKISDFFRPHSLGDYLNFPSMKRFREKVRDWIAGTPLFDGSFGSRIPGSPSSEYLLLARFLLNHHVLYAESVMGFSDDPVEIERVCFNTGSPILDFENAPDASYGYVLGNDAMGSEVGAGSVMIRGLYSLFRYICEKYPLVSAYYSIPSELYSVDNLTDAGALIEGIITDWTARNELGTFDFNYLDVLYRLYKVDAQTIFADWFEYVVGLLLFNPDLEVFSSTTMDLTTYTLMSIDYLPNILGDKMEAIDWTYFGAYWKIISDWYINTNIDGDPNDFFDAHFHWFSEDGDYIDLEPFNRRWVNDIFTSSVPSSKVTNVLIPADGTIPDLREANAFQRLVDILRNTGNRLRDVLQGIRGFRPTAEASDMAIPVSSKHFYVGLNSVLQTSQTTSESAQASYAGVGISKSDFQPLFKVINNDEPTPVVVMVLMSVTQLPTYMQGFPREFFRNSIYDFAIPQLANIGEQEVMTKELYFDYDDEGEMNLTRIFGFNRRYYDWFFEQSEVHGDLRDTEDFWTGARIFDSVPALDSEFIEINSEKDHLGRIFANSSPESANIYYNVVFAGEKVVALPRYIQYDL